MTSPYPPEGDISDIELVEGRLEGLKILLDTPTDKRTMTDAELKYAIDEVQIILNCMKITANPPISQQQEPKSNWGTLVGFVFYVCPCMALTVWISGLAGASQWFQWGMAMFALLFCTVLMLWVKPMYGIDAALDDWARQKAEIDARIAEEERKNPRPAELHDFKWTILSMIVAMGVFVIIPDTVHFVIKWLFFFAVYIIMLSIEPKIKTKEGK